jgi:hypothetical protein
MKLSGKDVKRYWVIDSPELTEALIRIDAVKRRHGLNLGEIFTEIFWAGLEPALRKIERNRQKKE